MTNEELIEKIEKEVITFMTTKPDEEAPDIPALVISRLRLAKELEEALELLISIINTNHPRGLSKLENNKIKQSKQTLERWRRS